MSIWIISDTHFGHRKLEELAGRPANFEEKIFQKLKKIKKGDTVIHLGDFCIGSDVEWHEKWNTALKDVKRILVKGNHDRKSNHWYYDHGWDFVCDQMSDHFFKRYVTLSHKPILGIQNINIHGHLHTNDHRVDEETKKHYNPNLHKLIALESNGYTPVLIEHILLK